MTEPARFSVAAARAARREVEKVGPVLELEGGDTVTFPPEPPANVIEAFGTTFRTGDPGPTVDALRRLVGPDQWAKLGYDSGELELSVFQEFVQWLLGAYGLTPGESSGSNGSSPSTSSR